MKGRRGKNALGKKKRWSETKKAKEKAFVAMAPAAATNSEDQAPTTTRNERKLAKWMAKRSAGKGVSNSATPKKKRAPKVRHQDEHGDTVVEHGFSDSDSEDEQAAAQRRAEQTAEASRRRRQVRVRGLPEAIKKRAVKALLQSCGIIAAVEVSKDKEGKPTVTVTFNEEEDVLKALEFHGRDYQARSLCVKAVVPPQVLSQGTEKRKKPMKARPPIDGSDASESEEDSTKPGIGKGHGKGGKSGKGGQGSKGKGKGKDGKRRKGRKGKGGHANAQGQM
eukprot:TRINITY_DN15095_c0_g1_i1.p1 TRINITY_DN15095_c0_g1~~TRINITY_DN15095_c0_g1_i1.p1  ORF type:complete len:286 (+),score=64.76 TRINITY_DN15095_c0_g1_i1:23-859(+)